MDKIENQFQGRGRVPLLLLKSLSSIYFGDDFLQTTTRNARSVGDLSKSSHFIPFSLFAMGLMVDLLHALPMSCLAIPQSRGNIVFRPRLIAVFRLFMRLPTGHPFEHEAFPPLSTVILDSPVR